MKKIKENPNLYIKITNNNKIIILWKKVNYKLVKKMIKSLIKVKKFNKKINKKFL